MTKIEPVEAQKDVYLYRTIREFPGRWVVVRDDGEHEIDGLVSHWYRVTAESNDEEVVRVLAEEEERASGKPCFIVEVPADWKPASVILGEALHEAIFLKEPEVVGGCRVVDYIDTRRK